MSRTRLSRAICSLISHRDRRGPLSLTAMRRAEIGVSDGVAYQLVPWLPGEEDPCGFLSGLIDWENHFTYETDGYIRRAMFVEDGARTGWLDSPELLASFSGGGDTPGCSPHLPVPNSCMTKVGPMYSGLMRKYVQLLQGMLQPIAYNFCWAETHGIYVAADGSHWVIEISIEDGITAWELPICEVLTPERKAELGVDLPYLPSATAGIPPVGSRIQLAPATELADYAGTTPFYPESGWAFRYDGHEAQNMTWYWPDTWKRTRRTMVTISEAGGVPNSATVSVEEETYLSGDNEGAMKFPQHTVTGMDLRTVDMSYEEAPPPGLESRLPMDVFYMEGHDIPCIQYNDGTGTPPDEYVDTTPNIKYCSGSAIWGYERYPGASPRVTGSFWKVFSGRRRFTLDGPVATPPDPAADRPAFTANDVFDEIWSEQDGGWVHVQSNTVYSQHWTCHQIRAAGTYSYTQSQTVIKPFFNREGLIYYFKEREWATYPGPGYRNHGLAYGDKYGSCLIADHFSMPQCFDEGESGRYQTRTCDTPAPPPETVTEFYAHYGSYNALDEPFQCSSWPFQPPHCDPPVSTTFWKNVTGINYSTPCPGTQFPGAMETEQTGRQALWAMSEKSGTMEKVREWDEYNALDPYTAINLAGEIGSQLMASFPDVFSHSEFGSNEMNGNQGGEYYFFGSPEDYYPLSDMGGGWNRTFIGIPLKEEQ